jgi:hypothetical protein
VFDRYNITDERDLTEAAWKGRALMAENLKRACEKRASEKVPKESQVGQVAPELVG